MRIGIFTDSYKPYTSGVVTSITTFKEELERHGHQVYIFAPSYPQECEPEENVFRFYSLPSPTNPDFALAIPVLPGLNMLVKRLNLDIIHVHSPFTMGRVGLRYSCKYGIPIVFTYHTLYDQYVHYVPVAQELAKEVVIRYSNDFCNHCDHIIVPTTEVEQILKKYKNRTPITVLPTGVPLHKLQKGNSGWLKENYPIPEENKVLLFVGRLTKEKNLEFLIEAFRLVKDRYPHTTLVLTAQGPMEGELKRLTTRLGMNLEQDVVFTGALPFETLAHVYHSADLFVFSSMTETQGLVLIEAMATGLPVVAIKAYGVQDMVDHMVNGLLTECDLQEFSNAICTLLADEELYNRFKEQALQKAYNLSAENAARKLEEVYQSLLEKNVPRKPRLLDFGAWFGS
ncbi:MAG TPA: glycosyltransferase family 4 protein [Syntrophomonadaceae bacterium]|nr:glycosyltransferase family 4 protein [Syntrophomonadaceae bacterium]HPU47732.1 glycosyltransferase family 4 protein [Syntrophomonadaceae bacterium]